MRKVVFGLSVFTSILATPAFAESSAVLVGVGEYDDPLISDLKGPANDVEGMREVFEDRFGMDRIVTLTSAGTAPTLETITAAMDDAAARAETGDLVVLFLAGHGSQQKDLSGDETDGYDEVFLPSDAGALAPDKADGTIGNALSDDRIGAFVDAVRARGATVWLIMDSCHSGTGARAADRSVTARTVPPEVFGIEAPTVVAAVEPLADDATARGGGTTDGPGGLVAFYAAQPRELAYEKRFGEGDEARHLGIFSATLAGRLRSFGGGNYRQLFEAVLSDMNRASATGRARQTPLIEGDAVRAEVGTVGGVSGAVQYALRGSRLEAGQVQGIGRGSVLAVVDDPLAGADGVTGHVRVTKANALDAVVETVSGPCANGPDAEGCEVLTSSDFLRRGTHARPVSVAVDLTLGLSTPLLLDCEDPLDASTCPEAAQGGHDRLRQALEAAVADPDAVGARIALDAAEPDIALAFKDGRIWFSRDGSFRVEGLPSAVAWPADGRSASVTGNAEEMLDTLGRIARAVNVMRLAAGIEAQDHGAPPLDVEGRSFSAVAADLSRSTDVPRREDVASYDVFIRDECDRTAGDEGSAEALVMGTSLHQCDYLDFALAPAPGRVTSFDVNRIYVDTTFGITVEHSRIDGPAGPDAVDVTVGQVMCTECPDGSGAPGIEEMAFFYAPAVKGAAPFDLRGLEQRGVGRARSAAARGELSAADAILAMAEPGASRHGFTRRRSTRDVGARVFRWRLVPREEARTGMIEMSSMGGNQ